jgi:hypothetical protein
MAQNQDTSRNAVAKRGGLSLAIDENGVAKTIITEDAQDVDMEGASVSEGESFDDTDFQISYSQNNSFAFSSQADMSNGYTHPAGPHGHAKSNSHSTVASFNSAKQSSGISTASNTNTRGSDEAQGRRKRPLLDPSLEFETLMEDAPGGNAQHALRVILQDRSRSTSAQGNRSKATQLQSSPPLQQSQYALYNASPTTITDPDLATPSTDRESLSSNMSTRCVCSSFILDGSVPMVQW